MILPCPEDAKKYMIYDMVPEGMITVDAAAEKYNIPRTTIRTWMYRDVIPIVAKLKASAPGGGQNLTWECPLALKAKEPRRRGRPKKENDLAR